ncbi:hypothetical protein GJT84_02475 (plasmid) [Enterobacteriaceae endosymbiont of Plateumaris sericea]|uniref:plasmid replication initiator TrfA n=1 Tax=Enterobacteriaceae endosymbiont of Plateumaris sericea TaxID=2675797 RepID=UPI001449EA35|nr:plasmid replication initiator TrfA [Enterobacteriaceae endosymbiont of Plateumaris sericea]QJC30217.1 hypothetical protein GJT84_02475 [Enterobacteriaceae endosymbiont of Plateumaris sericea]
MYKSLYTRISKLASKSNSRISSCNKNKKILFNSSNISKEDENIFIKKRMPIISNSKRAVPNIMLRSSLFGVIKKGYRKYEKNVLKATLNNIYIRFTGESLDQSDLDVWLECLHRLKKVPLGEKVQFKSYDFLKSINRNTGKSDYEWLKSCLVRLSVCGIEIRNEYFFYMGHLLHEWYRNEKTKEHIIILNKKIIYFFSDTMWTGVSLKERMKLKGKSLSQWIHCFYCSHNIPLPYKVNTLYKLCGSNINILWKFRQNLKKSLKEVSLATGWKCLIDIHDFVHIEK